MSGDLLEFPASDELAIEPEPDVLIEIEPEPLELEAVAPLALVSRGLVEILPADFPLPILAKFIPNPALKLAAEEASAYALGLVVTGTEGLQRADLALTALRASLKAITEHFQEPARIANELHKAVTSIRGEWTATGDAAIKTVGQRIYTEQKRLEAVAAEERRKTQAEADRLAREAAQREAKAAEAAQAPAPVVEELKRQAETATAPPVQTPVSAPPAMRGSTTVAKWKARIAGTSGADDPNPTMENLSAAQRAIVLDLMNMIWQGKAPLACFELNWSYLNRRAAADKGTLAIPGIEAFDEGGVRAKGSRSR